MQLAYASGSLGPFVAVALMVGSRSPSSGSKATHQSTSIYTLREKLQSVLNGTGKHVELCSLRIFKLAKQHLNVLHLII